VASKKSQWRQPRHPGHSALIDSEMLAKAATMGLSLSGSTRRRADRIIAGIEERKRRSKSSQELRADPRRRMPPGTVVQHTDYGRGVLIEWVQGPLRAIVMLESGTTIEERDLTKLS